MDIDKVMFVYSCISQATGLSSVRITSTMTQVKKSKILQLFYQFLLLIVLITNTCHFWQLFQYTDDAEHLYSIYLYYVSNLIDVSISVFVILFTLQNYKHLHDINIVLLEVMGDSSETKRTKLGLRKVIGSILVFLLSVLLAYFKVTDRPYKEDRLSQHFYVVCGMYPMVLFQFIILYFICFVRFVKFKLMDLKFVLRRRKNDLAGKRSEESANGAIFK